ncbi:MAG TPA: hypothetical protein VFP72_08180 [Kineosporiaceae bacterium]|nr:hypothetical protein [Kineosporiaceae bacterium]
MSQRLKDRDDLGFYTNMLFEDFSNLGLRGPFWRPAYVELGGAAATRDGRDDALVSLLDGYGQYGREDAQQLLRDYYSFCGSDILFYGASRAQVVPGLAGVDDEADDSPERLSLVRMVPWESSDGEPQPIAEGALVGHVLEVKLEKARSKEIGKAVAHLKEYDRRRPLETFDVLKVPEYDFTQHRRIMDRRLARATRCLGWDGRGLYLDRATSGYRVYRRLRFRAFQLEVLEVALEALNEVTRRLPDDPFEIRLPHSQNRSELQLVERRMGTGEISVDEAQKFLHSDIEWR